MVFNKDFWNNKYLTGETAWDTNRIVLPIKEYIDQLTNKELKILIPGAGNAYEVEYLYQLGFKNVYLLDWSDGAVENFKKRTVDFPDDQILIMDFFELQEQFDLVLEYTFFCALNPELRNNYVDKIDQILRTEGKLVGVLFDWDKEDGPPFGGSIAEYKSLFSPKFEINVLESCYNSIPPRAGKEVFIKLTKKS